MDAKSESSRKLSRQINKMARAQEEQELQKLREKEEAAQEEKKKKEEGFARSVITRKLSVFGSYRKMSFSCKPIIAAEVSYSWGYNLFTRCLFLEGGVRGEWGRGDKVRWEQSCLVLCRSL